MTDDSPRPDHLRGDCRALGGLDLSPDAVVQMVAALDFTCGWCSLSHRVALCAKHSAIFLAALTELGVELPTGPITLEADHE